MGGGPAWPGAPSLGALSLDDPEETEAPGDLAASEAGAPGVEVEDAVALEADRAMEVAEDDDPRLLALDPAEHLGRRAVVLPQVMDHGNLAPFEEEGGA